MASLLMTEPLKGVFSLVFHELLVHQEILNGTSKLSLPFQLSKECQSDKSALVSLESLEWNTLENMVIKWNKAFNNLNYLVTSI